MRTVVTCVLAAIATLAPLALPAEPAAGPSPDACGCAAELTSELRQLRGLLGELADADREDLELRRLTAAVMYLELRTRRVDALETRIEALRDDQRDIADQVEMYERNREMFESHIAELAEDSPDEAERVRSQLEAEISAAAARLDDVERRILDLENQVAAARRDLTGLEDYVNQGFGM